MDDNKLIQELVAASGLPEEFILSTLQRLFDRAGVNPAEAGIEDLRQITSGYLLEVFSEILDEGLRMDPATVA